VQAEEQAKKLAKEAADAARREEEKAARAAAAAQYRDAEWIAESSPDDSRSAICRHSRLLANTAGVPDAIVPPARYPLHV
jgi:hypothetical protein